jgi:hypothetical protein
MKVYKTTLQNGENCLMKRCKICDKLIDIQEASHRDYRDGLIELVVCETCKDHDSAKQIIKG